MTDTSDEPRDWKETFADWVWARAGWLVLGVLLLFALNNLIGLVVGAVGFLLFAHRLTGRLLHARRVVEQVRDRVADSGDSSQP